MLIKPYFLFNKDGDGEGSPPPATPHADPPAPGDTPPGTWEEIFQHPRFKELNTRAKAAEGALAKIEADRKAADDEAAKKQGEWQKLAEQREAELKAERLTRLRLEVATKNGVPPELAGRLTGSTEEELTSDAKALLEYLKPPKSGPGVPPISTKGSSTKPLDFSKMSPAEIRKVTEGKSINQVVNS